MEGQLLIVEDNPVNATTMSMQLEKYGFTSVVSHTGEKCLEILDKEKFDLVLLDIMMPGISGLEVLPRLREKYPAVDLPVIMVTSVDNNEKVVEALGLGANDYIVKPVKIEVAVARINTLLDASAFHRKRLDLERLEAIKAMVVTYNHEINNPMTVAMAEVKLAAKTGNTDNLQRAVDSLERITDIVRKISELTDGKIETADYLSDKMIKI